jgi:alginate O-acetyltransferase complex protein AlgI
MLFNSYSFLFLLLPAALAGYFLAARLAGRRAAMAWLVGASLVFYAWEDASLLLPVIAASVLGNYALGLLLARPLRAGLRKAVLAAGVAGNVAALAWFKDANFLAGTLAGILPGLGRLPRISLPLGLSFYTFQQIAFLVDVYRGRSRERGLLRYSLFVAFFPKLTAGPIVRHEELLPQFDRRNAGRPRAGDFSVGITLFVIGLVKKVLVADQIGPTASALFAAAEMRTPTFAEAWLGALAYTFQIYFDFSGYSDMALGVGRMFGIRLPLNFASPYKACNIIEFWRRWHMTLSRFLRDYLYIPLGGNRRGRARRYVNLMLTMLLGGIWHGTGWTFLFWGGLHGAYLCANHGWRALRGAGAGGGAQAARPSPAGRIAGWTVTFLAVVAAWVFFRARSFEAAGRILASMGGLHGLDLATSFRAGFPLAASVGLMAWVLAAPNSQQWLASFHPACDARQGPDAAALPRRFRWRPVPAIACATAVAFVIALMKLRGASEFVYWQF